MDVASPIEHNLPADVVMIAGGGPVGLILARVLSTHGIKSILFERNKTTTTWPKMDLTNARSMELFQRIGLADELRKQGVDPDIDQDVLMSTGMAQDDILSKWELPSVNRFRQRISEKNDGTQPREPWQRISQAIFEKWLKEICDKDSLIDLRYGWKVGTVAEGPEEVSLTVNDPTGVKHCFTGAYLAGCDGGSSTVRRSLSIPLDGGPIPVRAILVHFKSRDLRRLHKHGRFWHIFLLDPSGDLGGAIIAQDEKDTWTTHLFLPADADDDVDQQSSEEVVARVLGGMQSPYPITIDKVLVRSTWHPVIAVTRSWSGLHSRVFLAGDAAHQNIPTGGYGMNMGIGDAFDLGWKLASVITGIGGFKLLQSYEMERKPVAERNVARSGVHFQAHAELKNILCRENLDPSHVQDDSEAARRTKANVAQHYRENDGENKDFGIEMGYRYKSHIIVLDNDSEAVEPPWTPSEYTPTTWPGGRAPHIFLKDGRAIFDEFGKDWTLLSFDGDASSQDFLMSTAEGFNIPVKLVCLPGEDLVKRIYERKLVLIRPDQHVAWRGHVMESKQEAERILQIVTGK